MKKTDSRLILKIEETQQKVKGLQRNLALPPVSLQVLASMSAFTQLSGFLSGGKFCVILSVPRKPLFLSLLGVCLLPFPLRGNSGFSCAARSRLLMNFSAFILLFWEYKLLQG